MNANQFWNEVVVDPYSIDENLSNDVSKDDLETIKSSREDEMSCKTSFFWEYKLDEISCIWIFVW